MNLSPQISEKTYLKSALEVKSALCVFVEESSTDLSRNPRQNTKVHFAHIDLARCTFVFCRGMLDIFEIGQGNPRQISNLSFPDNVKHIFAFCISQFLDVQKCTLCFCRGFAFWPFVFLSSFGTDFKFVHLHIQDFVPTKRQKDKKTKCHLSHSELCTFWFVRPGALARGILHVFPQDPLLNWGLGASPKTVLTQLGAASSLHLAKLSWA